MESTSRRIALITATQNELIPMIKKLSAFDSEVEYIFDIPVWKANTPAEKGNVLLTFTGIGKANASFVTGVICSHYRIETIIHFGICGVYTGEPPDIGDVVIITKCFFGDEGVIYRGGEYGSYRDIGIPVITSWNKEAIYDSMETNSDLLKHLRVNFFPNQNNNFKVWFGSTVSVSMSSGSPEIAQKRHKKFGSMVEDMETCAIMIAAYRLRIPMIAVRGVSNICGDRNRRNWKMKEALNNTVETVFHILRRLKS